MRRRRLNNGINIAEFGFDVSNTNWRELAGKNTVKENV